MSKALVPIGAFIGAFVVALCPPSFARAEETKPTRPPNVLILMPDQWRSHALGAMGNRAVKSPNLDRLASDGALIPHTYANTPVCSPARATILTGKYPHRHGMMTNDLRLRETEVTLAEILRRHSYRTGFVGKWHLDGGIRDPGFVPPGPRRQGFEFWAASECSHRHFEPQYFKDDPKPIPSTKFEPEVWTDEAVEFIRQGASRPWFLMVAMGPPHDPYRAPETYQKQYDAATIPTRANFKDGVPRAGRNEIAAYYAMVTAIDDQVPRYIEALRAAGVEEDTIVVVTSDHGAMLGSQGQRLKRKPWDESIRVPGIIRYPRKIPAGRRDSLVLTHVDIAPTVLGLCGLNAPDFMQGRNLAPFLTGTQKEATPPDSAYLQNYTWYRVGPVRRWRGLRTPRYTYARHRDGAWVLYDNEKDPFQLENLAGRPEHAELEAGLDGRLVRWMAESGDSWDHGVERFLPLLHWPPCLDVDEFLTRFVEPRHEGMAFALGTGGLRSPVLAHGRVGVRLEETRATPAPSMDRRLLIYHTEWPAAFGSGDDDDDRAAGVTVPRAVLDPAAWIRVRKKGAAGDLEGTRKALGDIWTAAGEQAQLAPLARLRLSLDGAAAAQPDAGQLDPVGRVIFAETRLETAEVRAQIAVLASTQFDVLALKVNANRRQSVSGEIAFDLGPGTRSLHEVNVQAAVAGEVPDGAAPSAFLTGSFRRDGGGRSTCVVLVRVIAYGGNIDVPPSRERGDSPRIRVRGADDLLVLIDADVKADAATAEDLLAPRRQRLRSWTRSWWDVLRRHYSAETVQASRSP